MRRRVFQPRLTERERRNEHSIKVTLYTTDLVSEPDSNAFQTINLISSNELAINLGQ